MLTTNSILRIASKRVHTVPPSPPALVCSTLFSAGGAATTTSIPASSRPLSVSLRPTASIPRHHNTPGPSAFTFPSSSSSTQQRISQFQFPLQTSHSPLSTFGLRTMASTSTPAKHEFLCILPDKPGARAKRIEVRPSHLEGVKPLVANGTVVVGGATLESHPKEGETPAFTGSMLIAVAESAEIVREMISKDIYATSGVWDLEKMQIIPFKSAVRLGM